MAELGAQVLQCFAGRCPGRGRTCATAGVRPIRKAGPVSSVSTHLRSHSVRTRADYVRPTVYRYVTTVRRVRLRDDSSDESPPGDHSIVRPRMWQGTLWKTAS